MIMGFLMSYAIFSFSPEALAADVSGAWLISTKITAPTQCAGLYSRWIMILTQAANQVTGHWQTTTGARFEGQLSGSLKGSSLELNFDGTNTIKFTVTDGKIRGIWSGGSDCIPSMPGRNYGPQSGVFEGSRETISGVWVGKMKWELPARCERKKRTLPLKCTISKIGDRLKGNCAQGGVLWSFSIRGRRSSNGTKITGSGEGSTLTITGRLDGEKIIGRFKKLKGVCFNKKQKKDIEITIKGGFSLSKQ